VIRNVLRSILQEPAATDPPARVWRDVALVGLFVPGALLEIALRNGAGPKSVAVVATFVLAAAMWWRRTHPLATTVGTFGLFLTIDIVLNIIDEPPLEFYTAAVVLIVPYALFRWGSGRDTVIGLVAMIAIWLESIILNWLSFGDAIGGLLVLLFPAALGTIVRYRYDSRARSLQAVKLQEREQLARELHDTVAHHVSAIAIQAQAGKAVAATRPDAAIEALTTIENEASRTLAEMRAMVVALRGDTGVDMAPRSGIGDIERLADGARALDVRVERLGDFSGLRPSIDAAVFRMAQESITNAVRHARNATKVVVQVSADPEVVRLEVSDDGDGRPSDRSTTEGFGLVGMAERAHLLGGSLHAGPAPNGGWTVSATLPREGAAA